MSKDKGILIGVDLGNEKDCQCATLNLYYNGIDHIIFETNDKEQVKVLNGILEEINEEKTKLQLLKSIDNANPSEALKWFGEQWVEYGIQNTVMQIKDTKEYNIIKPALQKSQEQEKVLEIIKEKKVDIIYLEDSNNVNEYNSHFGCVVCKLTQEEFDLLKRWFK